jgi:hypothetical protein
MFEIAGGILLAIVILCLLPFLLVALFVVLCAVAMLGWVPLLAVGWWLYEHGGPGAQDPGGAMLMIGGIWLLCIVVAWLSQWEESRKLTKPAPQPQQQQPPSGTKRGFALPPAGWKPFVWAEGLTLTFDDAQLTLQGADYLI